MTIFLIILFWLAAGWIFYVFIGYPLLMALLARVRAKPLRPVAGYHPSVCFVMAAYNEAGCIGEKLQNYMDLDYPRELLSFMIGSDASTDATDGIIESYAARDSSIVLTRFNRVGKTQIVYELAERVGADIIVFTDADILLERDGVRVIAGCMADPTIGGVIGTIAYRDTEANAGNTGQGKYLQLENTLRRCESLFWTTVGPDGECFAVKRGSYEPLRDYRLSDDLNLVITIPSRGLRVWYEPKLLLQEINRRSLTSEYRRRLRMGQQAAATLLSYRETRFPWRSLAGFQIWSHKLLRNLAAIPMALVVVTSLLLAILLPESLFFTVAAGLALLWGVALVIGLVGERLSFKFRPLQYPLYFTSMLTSLTIGSMRAVFSGGLEMWNSPREGG